MSGFSCAAKWHEGLTSEELDHATATSGIHQSSKRDRRVGFAFVLCLAAITVIAAATLARVAPPSMRIGTIDADLFIEQSLSPGSKPQCGASP